MPHRLMVEAASEAELPLALELVFQHQQGEDRESRVRNALRLIRQGELDPAGVLVAKEGQALVGAIVCLPVPGASGLIWPPQALENRDPAIEDQLMTHGCEWLRRSGTKLVQTLLPPEESQLAAPLLRHGFVHITKLRYLRHELNLPADSGPQRAQISCQSYTECDQGAFQQTLLATYEGTLDCPEINGVRDVTEILDGHRSQGVHDPKRWWLAFEAGRPVGVVLLTAIPEWEGWDVSYLGVIPEARRRGVGRELTRKALHEARRSGATQVTLALDTRNHPAANLYRRLGFTSFDEREVYLAIWNKSGARIHD